MDSTIKRWSEQEQLFALALAARLDSKAAGDMLARLLGDTAVLLDQRSHMDAIDQVEEALKRDNQAAYDAVGKLNQQVADKNERIAKLEQQLTECRIAKEEAPA